MLQIKRFLQLRRRGLSRKEEDYQSAGTQCSLLNLPLQDFQEVEERVVLFEGGHQGDAEEVGRKLRKLSTKELKQSVEGHSYWTETRLLDHKVGSIQLDSSSSIL